MGGGGGVSRRLHTTRITPAHRLTRPSASISHITQKLAKSASILQHDGVLTQMRHHNWGGAPYALRGSLDLECMQGAPYAPRGPDLERMQYALGRGGLRRVWRRRGIVLRRSAGSPGTGSYPGIPRRHHRRILFLLLLLARHVGHVLHARALRHCARAGRVTTRSADDARHRRLCATLGTVCTGRAFRFGGITVEAPAHLDATALSARRGATPLASVLATAPAAATAAAAAAAAAATAATAAATAAATTAAATAANTTAAATERWRRWRGHNPHLDATAAATSAAAAERWKR